MEFLSRSLGLTEPVPSLLMRVRTLCPSANKLTEFQSVKALTRERFGSHAEVTRLLSVVKKPQPQLLRWKSGG